MRRIQKLVTIILFVFILVMSASGCKSNAVKSGYVAYKTDNYSVTFQYPEDFVLEENIQADENLGIITAKNEADTKGIILGIFGTDIVTLDLLKDMAIEGDKAVDENAEIGAVKEITVDGFKAYTFDSTLTMKELRGDMTYKRRHIIAGDDKTAYTFYIYMSPELFDKEQQTVNYVIDSLHIK